MKSGIKKIYKNIRKLLSGQAGAGGETHSGKKAADPAKGRKDKGSNKNSSAGQGKRNSKRAKLKKELSIERAASDARIAFTEELRRRAGITTASGQSYAALYSGMILNDGFDRGSALSGVSAEDTGDKDDQYALLKALRAFAGERLLPDTVYSRGEFRYFSNRFSESINTAQTDADLAQMYTDWLFFCKDSGYDMDDYFDYEFYRRSLNDRQAFVSASFRDNIRRQLNNEPMALARKGQFLKSFSGFIRRPWLDCSECTADEFRSFCKDNPLFFCKAESGFGAESMQLLSPAQDEIDDLYVRCTEQKCVVEAPITQHDLISNFNPDTVNSIRVVTIADAEDQIVIASVAMRFGRAGGFADNYHHGGLCAHVDPSEGRISGDAIDRTGKHYAYHPDSKVRFDGFEIPCWDKLCETVSAAARSCMDSNRFIGWDLAVTKDGEIDFIEGNSRPGFGILQAPTMTGLKSEYIKILSGLMTEEELLDAGKGYWRKWKL